MTDTITPLAASLWKLNVVADSAGQLSFKAAAVDPPAGNALVGWKWMARRPWLWVGIACFVLEVVLWLAFLSLVSLSEGVLLARSTSSQSWWPVGTSSPNESRGCALRRCC